MPIHDSNRETVADTPKLNVSTICQYLHRAERFPTVAAYQAACITGIVNPLIHFSDDQLRKLDIQLRSRIAPSRTRKVDFIR